MKRTVKLILGIKDILIYKKNKVLKGSGKQNYFYVQISFHQDKQHGFIRFVENVVLTKIILTIDSALHCVMNGIHVVMHETWQMIRQYYSVGDVWEVAHTVTWFQYVRHKKG